MDDKTSTFLLSGVITRATETSDAQIARTLKELGTAFVLNYQPSPDDMRRKLLDMSAVSSRYGFH